MGLSPETDREGVEADRSADAVRVGGLGVALEMARRGALVAAGAIYDLGRGLGTRRSCGGSAAVSHCDEGEKWLGTAFSFLIPSSVETSEHE